MCLSLSLRASNLYRCFLCQLINECRPSQLRFRTLASPPARVPTSPLVACDSASVSPTTFIILFFASTAAGCIDAIAGGGGLISVPTLLAVGIPPQLALGTSKAQSTVGTMMSTWRYARAGLINWKEVRPAMIITFIASIAGAWVLLHTSNRVLGLIIPWALMGVALYVYLNPKLGEEIKPARMSVAIFALLFGGLIGFYDGFFGPGTGAFWTLAIVGLLGHELTKATAYTKAVNLASNVGAASFLIWKGDVLWPAALIMICGQLIGNYVGADLVLHRGSAFIRKVFLVVVVALTLSLFLRR